MSLISSIVEWTTNNPPNAILAWLGLLTTFSLALTKLSEALRDRRRIQIKVVTSYVHCRYWHQSELESARSEFGEGAKQKEPPNLMGRIVVRAGDCKARFEVLEFTLKNRYPHDITIGCFAAAGWMFSDRYPPGMYDRARDYRVFDLFTRKPISLEDYRTLPPGGMLGMRIESFEKENAGRPTWVSNHLYYTANNPKSYEITFNSDMGRGRHRIVPSAPASNPPDFEYEYRWSTDIGGLGPMTKLRGGAAPQGSWQPVPYRVPWHRRLRIWFGARVSSVRKRVRTIVF